MPAIVTKLCLEALDSRTLPSVTLPVTTTSPGTIAVSTVNPSHPVQGVGMGSYVGNTLAVDAGQHDTLKASVKLETLGSFQLSGWLQGVGMIAEGRATGELVLSNGKGTITLELHSQVETSFTPIPSQFVYSISSSTGAYSNEKGYGIVTFHFMPAPVAFGLPPRGLLTLSIS